MVTNPAQNELAVIDAAVDQVIRHVETEARPDQVAFTNRIAYVRQANSPMVRLIPLDGISAPDRPVTVLDVPGGRNPLGQVRIPSLAPAIVQASGEDAVLIANPADQTLYYYQEGFSAPLGSFRNYGHEPRAVLAVDRSLRPAGPGVYQTVARLRRSGRFNVAFFLDSPRLLHCFELEIADDPRQLPAAPAVDVRLVSGEDHLVAGKAGQLQFRLFDRQSRNSISGKVDVRVLATLPGRWQRMYEAAAGPGKEGTYAIDFTPPRAGLFFFYVECPSANLALRNSDVLHLEVKEPL